MCIRDRLRPATSLPFLFHSCTHLLWLPLLMSVLWPVHWPLGGNSLQSLLGPTPSTSQAPAALPECLRRRKLPWTQLNKSFSPLSCFFQSHFLATEIETKSQTFWDWLFLASASLVHEVVTLTAGWHYVYYTDHEILWLFLLYKTRLWAACVYRLRWTEVFLE